MSVFLIIAVLSLGCDPPEPVLSGIPANPILEEQNEEDDNGAAKAPRTYVKAEDVTIDVRHICGKNIDNVRTQIHEQLGTKQSVRMLKGNHGREIQYTRGRIRVHDDVVYMVNIPLNEPLYRREALQQLGFPPFTGGVIRTSREYRINNAWDFRRIRMKRAGRDAEKVTEVEVWRWLPRERQ
mgnify:CR=1 FL=1